jgi:hypothetical protein
MAPNAPPDRSSDPLWRWFAASSVAFLAVLAISPVKDYFREYRQYQEGYRQRLLTVAGSSKELKAAQAETVRIRQYWIPALGDRVDRCVSCHLGVENPQMAGAELPYRAHPPTPHTPDEFGRLGCVICHRGQGRATNRREAHWQYRPGVRRSCRCDIPRRPAALATAASTYPRRPS